MHVLELIDSLKNRVTGCCGATFGAVARKIRVPGCRGATFGAVARKNRVTGCRGATFEAVPSELQPDINFWQDSCTAKKHKLQGNGFHGLALLSSNRLSITLSQVTSSNAIECDPNRLDRPVRRERHPVDADDAVIRICLG